MTSHTSLRLEKDSQVVMWFAPRFEARLGGANENVTHAAIPPGETADATPIPYGGWPLIQDLQMWKPTIVIQGAFLDDKHLSPEHRAALRTLLDKPVVTAKDQLRHLLDHFTGHGKGGPYELYDAGDAYTAMARGDEDVANGVFPAVVPLDFHMRSQRGRGDARPWQFEFAIGFPIGGG